MLIAPPSPPPPRNPAKPETTPTRPRQLHHPCTPLPVFSLIRLRATREARGGQPRIRRAAAIAGSALGLDDWRNKRESLTAISTAHERPRHKRTRTSPTRMSQRRRWWDSVSRLWPAIIDYSSCGDWRWTEVDVRVSREPEVDAWTSDLDDLFAAIFLYLDLWNSKLDDLVQGKWTVGTSVKYVFFFLLREKRKLCTLLDEKTSILLLLFFFHFYIWHGRRDTNARVADEDVLARSLMGFYLVHVSG